MTGIAASTKFQEEVGAWLLLCFGHTVANDLTERCFRFLEESNELAQSLGITREQAHSLVDYTWDRPLGEPEQEMGGVMVTLAALAHASHMGMEAEAWTELGRICKPEVIEKIRNKQKTKPHQSALPGSTLEGYHQHPDVIGYIHKEALADLLDEAQPGGSYVGVGLDHKTCWAEEPPYDSLNLVPVYLKPQAAVTMHDVAAALEKIPGGPVLTSNHMWALARNLNRLLSVSKTEPADPGKLDSET